MSRVSDLMGVLKGVKKVVGAIQRQVERQTSDAWLHSSIRDGIENASSSTKTAADLGKTFVDSIPQPILDARMKIDEAGEKLVCALGSVKSTRDTGQVKIDKEEKLYDVKDTINKLQETVEGASSSVKELADHMAKGQLTDALNEVNDRINAFEKDDIVGTEDIHGGGLSVEQEISKKDLKSSDHPDFSKLLDSIKNDIFSLDKTAVTLQQTAKTVENEMNVLIENFSIQAQHSGIINEQFLDSMGDFKIGDSIDSAAMGTYPIAENNSNQTSQFNNKDLHVVDAIKQELTALQIATEELQASTNFVKEDMTKILESISRGDFPSAANVAFTRVESATHFVDHDFSADITATATGFYPGVSNADLVSEEDIGSVEGVTDFINHDFSDNITATATGIYPAVSNADPVSEEDIRSVEGATNFVDHDFSDDITATATGIYPDNSNPDPVPEEDTVPIESATDFVDDDYSDDITDTTTAFPPDISNLEPVPEEDTVSIESATDIVDHDYSDAKNATETGFYPDVSSPDPVTEEDAPSSTSLEEEQTPEITQGNYTNPFSSKPFPVNGVPPTRDYCTLSQRPSIYQLYLRRLATSGKSIKPPDGPILKHAAESYLKGTNDDYSALASYNFSKRNQDANSKKRKRINTKSKRRAVPDTRFKRVFAFSGLAASLGWSTILEMSRRAVSESGSDKKGILMREENMEIIVSKLCEVRGAALKIGQMLSMQDSAVLNPQLTEILRRVRDNADFMPEYQLNEQMTANIGENWLDKFKDFDQIPFAAASLGQVHYATLHNGTKAVVKVQYPGVATSINSDIDNFARVISVLDMIPKGVYIEQTMKIAKEELAFETDYCREAKSQMKMRDLLLNDPDYDVPEVFLDLSGKSVLTQEFVAGEPIDTFTDAPEALRNAIGLKMLKLCLRELFEFRFMQTDPNWSNFFYDTETGKIKLLDFGASLNLTDEFTAEYLKIIRSCATGDRQTIIDSSIKMGFLTGYESEVMVNAHCEAITVVGEPFSTDDDYDFVAKNASVRVGRLLSVFAKHRLTAPPRESYALNRKLSGAFLLCNKLHCVIPCKPLFDTVYNHRTEET